MLSAVVAAVCAVVPGWQASRGEPQKGLGSGSRGDDAALQHRWLLGLVAAEMALTLVLLLGAALVLRGFQALVTEDPGFDPQPLLTLAVSLDPNRYVDQSTAERFLMPALERIRSAPGVTEAGALSAIPYDNWGNNFNVRYEGQAGTDPTQLPLVESRVATPGTFAAIGHRLARGRLLNADDRSRRRRRGGGEPRAG